MLLLSATLILFAFLIFKMDFIFVPLAVTLLAAYQVFSLIYFIEKTNRALSRFLLSINYDDASQSFTSQGLGSSFDELKEAFSNVLSKLQTSRSEKEVQADPDLMEQVMINLILNAIDAVNGCKDPAVTLSAIMDAEGKAVVMVKDNGTGIVDEALERIFIPFFTTKKQGSGIGLSLSRQILRMHHATIRAHSKVNEGALFTIKFA